MKTLCVMSNTKNVFGYTGCNSTVDPIHMYGRVYCMGHYKKCINECRICQTPRGEEHISFNGWFYCDQHKPKWEHYEKLVTKMLSNHLDFDVSEKIIGFLKTDIDNDISTEYKNHIKSPKERYTVS